MSAFIAANAYAIGYIDAGHGHEAGLGEIALQHADGEYLRTNEADIGAAGVAGLSAGVIPADPTVDFSAVNLYDLAGATTWPITMISYFYLDPDMTAMDPDTWFAGLRGSTCSGRAVGRECGVLGERRDDLYGAGRGRRRRCPRCRRPRRT
mgnify:CR=1 FL=1